MQNLILNRYRPLEIAGSGGFATVQVAWDTRIQRRVAIKCLRLDTFGQAATPSTPRDIPGLDEARTAAMLSDSHIVGVYDFEIEGPMAYLIMEYVDGVTLTELMREEGGALSLDVVTCVFEAVAHALEVAHDNQVLHLDIKPDNVLINRQGQVKVTDFGLAQLSHEAGFGQASGGTIGYMPLEQMRLEAPDVRTDEWALASLTYQMLTGYNPFLARDLASAQRAIEDAEIVIPSLARGDVDEEVDEAVFGALAIDREDRFESVSLFADAMMPHLGSARRGARELAAIVGEACDDEEEIEDGTEAMPAVVRARTGLAEISAVIESADLSERARCTALRIFDILAKAEAQAHGVPIDQVHFHEVGAVDSIVDIVAAAICLDDLGIDDVVITGLVEGCGTVRCQHGVLPIPVPAVANIVANEGLPISISSVRGELVTPTGAAIAAAVRTKSALPERFVIKKVGIGAGKRSYERPSLVRAMLIEEAGTSASSADVATPHGGPFVWKLETEVDDCSGEALGYAMECLFAAGAREAHYAPVFMKKNRPAYQIQVLCAEEDIAVLEQVLFEETTTIGVRRTPMQRTVLPREIVPIETAFGPMRAKRVVLPDGAVRLYPEYEDVARVSRERKVAYQEVYREALCSCSAASSSSLS